MLIIHNAQIYTMDKLRPTASAAVVDHGKILAVGDDQQIISNFYDRMKSYHDERYIVDLENRVVIPGLIDAHIHLQHYATGLHQIDCETKTRRECLERVAERARRTPPGMWILGHGWNQNNWPEGFGSAADLDAVAPENPVYLTAKSLHAGWANQQAMRLANIQEFTDDPVDGRFGRNLDGRANGILFEEAMQVVEKVIPEPEVEQVAEAIRSTQSILWRMGLTGVQDFDQQKCFAALQHLRQEETLKLRVTKSIPLESLDHAIALGLHSGFGDDFLRIGSVKAFADGALGPQTAAMLQPYNQSPDNRGMLLLDAEEIFEFGSRAVRNGLSLAIHAIGDRANHEVLEAYSQLRIFESEQFFEGDQQAAIQHGARHRIEHVQVIHPEDVRRLEKLGIIASMQPVHATSDRVMAERFWGERSALAYAWMAQLASGAVLAFGSDAPVESPNPFWGIHAAVTRKGRDDNPDQVGWRAEQCLSVTEAVQGYTIGAAYAAGMENRLGQIKPGYLADLVILSDNPFTCDPDQLHTIESVATMVSGEWVHRVI